MSENKETGLERRELLGITIPACAMACLGFSGAAGLLACEMGGSQKVHKFQVKRSLELSRLERRLLQNRNLFQFIMNVRPVIGEEELIRLLNIHSAAEGKKAGESQAESSPDRDFQTFVSVFRPPRFGTTLTHEIVEDNEKALGLRVTECLNAEAFKAAGLDGEIGHAAVCNMDYYWPTAFNPDFKMERTKTLMQGDDQCNHRYIDTA